MPKGPKGEKRPADVIGAAIIVAKIATGEIEDHRRKLEPCYSIRLSAEFTPAELDCLRLAIVGTGVSVLSHLNAMPVAPN